MNPNQGLSKETTRRYLINFVMFILLLFVTASSLYFLYVPGGYQGGRNPRYNMQIIFTRHTWGEIHFWTSMVLSAILLAHIALHHKWIRSVFFRFMKTWQQSLQSRNYLRLFNLLDDVLSALFFLVCLVSGLILFYVPGGRETKTLEVLYFTRDAWKSIHTISGIGMLTGIGLHLFIHWGWIKKVTRNIAGLRNFPPVIGKTGRI